MEYVTEFTLVIVLDYLWGVLIINFSDKVRDILHWHEYGIKIP